LTRPVKQLENLTKSLIGQALMLHLSPNQKATSQPHLESRWLHCQHILNSKSNLSCKLAIEMQLEYSFSATEKGKLWKRWPARWI